MTGGASSAWTAAMKAARTVEAVLIRRTIVVVGEPPGRGSCSLPERGRVPKSVSATFFASSSLTAVDGNEKTGTCLLTCCCCGCCGASGTAPSAAAASSRLGGETRVAAALFARHWVGEASCCRAVSWTCLRPS